MSHNSLVLYGGAFTFAAVAMVFYLFQKGKLPLTLAKMAGRGFFYPTLPFSIAYYYWRGPWWSPVDPHVYLGALPIAFLGHVQKMKKMGIEAVINLCDEYNGPISEYEKFGIEQLRIPVIDHTEPSTTEIKKCIDFIEKRIKENKKVLCHCKAGHGRR